MGFDVLDEYECQGQLSIEDFLSESDIPESIFGVSQIFASARKSMNLQELKAFTYALTHIRFKGKNGTKFLLDKKTLAAIVGVHSDPDHLSEDLKRSIGHLPQNSFIEIEDKDRDFFESGVLVTGLRMYKRNVSITFNADYMPLFEQLERAYITMWSGDIFRMRSSRSVEFYEQLRLHTDTRLDLNKADLGIKYFKELFGIPKSGKGSYMREKGGFDRSNFEKFVIDPLCEDLSHCRMISLVLQPSGKYYEKIKKGGRVVAYRFFWVYTSHPGIAPAQEMHETRQAIEKNPEIIKIANDIAHRHRQKSTKIDELSISGTKKSTKRAANDGLIHQEDYNDFDALERELLGVTDAEYKENKEK